MNSEARPAGTAALPEANDVEKKDPNECNYVQNNKRSHGKGRGGYKGRGRDNYSNGQTTTRPAGKETTITVVVVPTMAVAEAVMAEVEAAYPNRFTRPNPFVKDVGWTTIGPRINKNPEAHMVHDSGYDADDDSDFANNDLMDFETSDCLKD
ncbi:uncharacterized protein LOC125598986 [Brassica napus]|uniref:uncharacterized protein LOC125598986 n=1 Tax=Brassica napus TaxID=3708 RepID=UPI002078616D|nr:uncharacterized protein LOC125598986 [Brassica napus]